MAEPARADEPERSRAAEQKYPGVAMTLSMPELPSIERFNQEMQKIADLFEFSRWVYYQQRGKFDYFRGLAEVVPSRGHTEEPRIVSIESGSLHIVLEWVAVPGGVFASLRGFIYLWSQVEHLRFTRKELIYKTKLVQILIDELPQPANFPAPSDSARYRREFAESMWAQITTKAKTCIRNARSNRRDRDLHIRSEH